MAQIYRVRKGDYLIGIARRFGFRWQTIWEDPSNAELRELRGDPNILHPGDIVTIPSRAPRAESGATGAKHVFRAKGRWATLNMRLLEEGRPGTTESVPMADVPYQVRVGSRTYTGTTDGDGRLSCEILVVEDTAELVVHPGTDEAMTWPIEIGHLDPIEEPTGVRQRLSNLGFDVDSDEGLAEALRLFQLAKSLEPTGDLDESTREALASAHEC